MIHVYSIILPSLIACKAFELSAVQMKQIIKKLHGEDVDLWLDYQGEKILFLTEPQFYCAIFESHSDLTKIIMTDNHKRLNESGADSKFEKCFL